MLLLSKDVWQRMCGFAALLLSLAGAGCQGSLDGAAAPGAPPLPAGGGSGSGSGGSTQAGGGDSAVCQALPSRRIRRLARREYANVISDLLGAAAGDAARAALPAEPRVRGFDNQDAFLFVSGPFQETVADLAATLAAKADVAVLAPCSTGDTQACIASFIQSFGGRAYGRELTQDELARAVAVAALGESFAASVRLVIELVLQSPHLLYVTELGAADAPSAPQAPVPLTSEELASQLSFLLAGTRPDATLRDAARHGDLATPGGLRAQAERMLADQRGAEALTRFIAGWLDLGPISDMPKSADAFPEFSDAVANAMQAELDAFVAEQLKGGDGTLPSFFTTVPSRALASPLAAIYGADLQPSGLDPSHRRGVLSLPALLTYHAADAHSGPVERGLLVRRQLLCQDVPPPPPAALERIANQPVDDLDAAHTTRQKFAAHVDEATCKACHQSFDPIGFGLEDMDGIGRFRTTEHGLPVDSRGELTGTDVDGPFEGPAQLSAKLAESKQVAACMAAHFFEFALARPAGADDACLLDVWTRNFLTGGQRIKDLVFGYVSDPAFVTRKDDR
jgi:hypothetical protein